MNIWMVHPFAGGPGLGPHWRPFWLADAWIKMGHKPLVISAGSHHLRGALRRQGPEKIGGVDFWFVATPSYGSNLGRLRNNLSFGPRLRRDAAAIEKKFGKPDLVIASSPHLFFVSAAHRLARHLGAKFWVEVRDLWPKSIVALGLAPSWHPLVGLLGWQERFAYRHADRVVSLLANAEAHMKSRGLAAGKFKWIPNGISSDEIESAREIGLRTHPLVDRIRELKRAGRQVVLYAGAMGPPNAMEVIVDAARELQATNPEIHFVLVGFGSLLQQLKRRATGLSNIEFHDEVDRPIVHGMLHASDGAVVSFHSNELYAHGISPNKLFDYCLFAPRSVIACEDRALAGLEDLVTWRCPPDDPGAMAAALVSALREPERSLAGRIEAAKPYSYSELAARYLEE